MSHLNVVTCDIFGIYSEYYCTKLKKEYKILVVRNGKNNTNKYNR